MRAPCKAHNYFEIPVHTPVLDHPDTPILSFQDRSSSNWCSLMLAHLRLHYQAQASLLL